MKRSLLPGGTFIALYSAWPSKDGDLGPETNLLGILLKERGIPCLCRDGYAHEREHWIAKKAILETLEADFRDEGKGLLFEKRYAEAAAFAGMATEGALTRYL